MQKTIRRNKKLQKELDEYLKDTDMPMEHAIAVVGGNLLRKTKNQGKK